MLEKVAAETSIIKSAYINSGDVLHQVLGSFLTAQSPPC
jgi:hypothetical protein